MALKGSFIGYTNGSGADATLTITRASYIMLISGGAALDYYTASQTVDDAQTLPANTTLQLDCSTSKQPDSDIFEDINIVLANTESISGFVAGRGVAWSVDEPGP